MSVLTPPVVTSPADIVLDVGEGSSVASSDPAVVSFLTGATAVDDKDGSGLVVTNNSPEAFAVGVHTITFSATDAVGNMGAAQVSITVNDLTAPEVTALACINVAAIDSGGTQASDSSISAFLNGATASDNVDGSLSPSHDAPATLPLGTTTVTFSATDSAGNSGTA